MILKSGFNYLKMEFGASLISINKPNCFIINSCDYNTNYKPY